MLRTLLVEEIAGRERSSAATRRAAAGFPTGKTFDAWNPDLSSVPAPTQHALRTLEWVGRAENLVVCGPSGTGKSMFLEALGQSAVETGRRVAWFSLESLGVLVRRHKADDTVNRAIARILRADLVRMSTTSALLPVGPDAAEGLYRLVDAAYGTTIPWPYSSNLHPSGFDELMPKTLATATVDRLMHHAHLAPPPANPSDSPKPPPATASLHYSSPATTHHHQQKEAAHHNPLAPPPEIWWPPATTFRWPPARRTHGRQPGEPNGR